jgi:hypothetical protein
VGSAQLLLVASCGSLVGDSCGRLGMNWLDARFSNELTEQIELFHLFHCACLRRRDSRVAHHDYQRLRSGDCHIHTVLVEQEFQPARPELTRAGAHGEDHHARFLSLEFVDRTDAGAGKCLLAVCAPACCRAQ